MLGCYLHDPLTSDTTPCGNLEWCRRDFINAVWIVPDLIRHFNVSGWPVKLNDLIHDHFFTNSVHVFSTQGHRWQALSTIKH
jgi:hypothetical protein